MALNAANTLEAFVDRLSRNSEIMNILKLPTIRDSDTDTVKNKKRKLLIDKVISKTAQVPQELGKDFPEVTINNIKYKGYGKIRITVAFAASIKMNSYLFGNPQVEINVYYDNTNMDNVLKLFDLISDEFSGQDIEIKINNESGILKQLKCQGITAQVAIINNYERVGIRFSYYATVYKN
jgi:hypothetical protein